MQTLLDRSRTTAQLGLPSLKPLPEVSLPQVDLVEGGPGEFLPSGRFQLGCNYWASHAGLFMWRDWRPEVVAEDLRQLAAADLRLVRVFPLWPDFQPLESLAGGGNRHREYRVHGQPLPDTPAGRAGLDEAMLQRFAELADLAGAAGLRLIVGLITGWMSGRTFAPPAFVGRALLADPEVVRWQGRFVRAFVERFRGHRAIVAWDLGNECNALDVPGADESWRWTHTISAAIRAADPTRPVISGMHSLSTDPDKPWSMAVQGELTDFLTTHPYPIWTPLCDQDAADTLRPQLHATAESRLYADLGGKPCFAEELGSMGPFILADARTPGFLRPSLFSLWAHDCRAMLWWCAYDQGHLEAPPYDWVQVERELGLIRADRSLKPHARAVGEFAAMLRRLPFDRLPPRLVEATCLIPRGEEGWPVAHNAFTLAKLAGVDLAFAPVEAEWPETPVYLLPSLDGLTGLPRRSLEKLLERVRAGATLYLSIGDGLLAGLESWAGVRVRDRSRSLGASPARLADGTELFSAPGEFRLRLEEAGAEVLARETDGNPVFTRFELGRGEVFLLTRPLEKLAAHTPGAFASAGFTEAWRIYRRVCARATARRVWPRPGGLVSATEHVVDAVERIVVLINHGAEVSSVPVAPAAGWVLVEVLHGPVALGGRVSVPAQDGLVLRVRREPASATEVGRAV
jgi:hypothetical protein